jgi:hypothetical protein
VDGGGVGSASNCALNVREPYGRQGAVNMERHSVVLSAPAMVHTLQVLVRQEHSRKLPDNTNCMSDRSRAGCCSYKQDGGGGDSWIYRAYVSKNRGPLRGWRTVWSNSSTQRCETGALRGAQGEGRGGCPTMKKPGLAPQLERHARTKPASVITSARSPPVPDLLKGAGRARAWRRRPLLVEHHVCTPCHPGERRHQSQRALANPAFAAPDVPE